MQVHKVRFVASTLLDTVKKAEPASAARAHAYLCMFSSCVFIWWGLGSFFDKGDFLSILSEIERNYLFVSKILFDGISLSFFFLRLDDDGTSSEDGMGMI